MGCKVIITRPAENDLEEIVDYISRELASPKAASDFLDKVGVCYENLENEPLMYAECQHDRLKAKRYRKAVIKNYLMIYRYDESQNTVYILRFIYGRRDYVDLL